MRAHVEAQASDGDRFVSVLVDLDVFERLAGRALSIGSHGYAQLWERPRMWLLHRWVLGLRVGDGLVGDHRDRNVLDCRRGNLRAVDGSASNLNRSPADRAAVGVYRARSGRWQAKARWRGAQHYLGTYDTKEAAMAAMTHWRATAHRSAA
jgi:hypothetical protein